MLFDIFTEYRNGNKKIFDTLYSDNVKRNKCKDYENGELVINDEGLNNLVNFLYAHYSLPYKFSKDDVCPKFSEQVYNGTKEDLKVDMMIVLHSLFNDKKFNPADSSDIYKAVSNKTKQLLGDNISTSVLADTDIRIDENGEEYSLLEAVSDKDLFKIETHCDYIGIMAEVVPIIRNYDIKQLLKKDADVQRKVIDTIYKYYDYCYDEVLDDNKLPRQEDMIEYYYKEYGSRISQSQYSRALNDIFKVICECTVQLKGAEITREDFVRGRRYGVQKLQQTQ